jgi:hypothetical protein
VNFSEQPPSDRWAALTFRGERIAEVWFKPEGEPLALVFRVPRSSLLALGQRLTAEKLLKAVAVAPDEVESWRCGDTSPSGELADPLPPPPDDDAHLEVHVRLTPPRPAAPEQRGEPAGAPRADLEALWEDVLLVEASVAALRLSVEGARAEVSAAAGRVLAGDDKVHALSADLAQWGRAKGRAQYALPKANDFIHRATWASTAPERKKLADLFETPAGARPPLPPADELQRDLELLRKSRQVLASQGTAVLQECRAIVSEVQGALRTLQRNAADRASKKKGGKGKSF